MSDFSFVHDVSTESPDAEGSEIVNMCETDDIFATCVDHLHRWCSGSASTSGAGAILGRVIQNTLNMAALLGAQVRGFSNTTDCLMSV